MKRKILTLLLALNILLSPALALSGIEYIHKDPNVYVFKLDSKKVGKKIKPYVVSELDTVKSVFEKNKFTLVVNGGFFDMNTGAPASFVTIDGAIVENPYDNLNLLDTFSDEEMEKIANRTEFRVLENARGSLRFDIAFHKDKAPENWQVKHALQAGPMIHPKMDLEKEFFVQYDDSGKLTRDAIDALKRRPRTVLAIDDNDVYIVIFAKQGGVTLDEAHQYCKKARFEKAMALDGGGSTSVNYQDIEIFSQDKCGRKVKSFLVVE